MYMHMIHLYCNSFSLVLIVRPFILIHFNIKSSTLSGQMLKQADNRHLKMREHVCLMQFFPYRHVTFTAVFYELPQCA